MLYITLASLIYITYSFFLDESFVKESFELLCLRFSIRSGIPKGEVLGLSTRKAQLHCRNVVLAWEGGTEDPKP